MINCICVPDHDDMNGGLREDCLIHGKQFEPAEVRSLRETILNPEWVRASQESAWGQIGKTPPRPSWDDWALAIAQVVSQRADCTRSKVGAVLLSHNHRVLSVGYNGVIAGVPGCLTAGNCPRGQLSYDEVSRDSDYANCIATHAERNAIEHAPPERLSDSTLYVTRKPCPACTTLITACGIKRVVTPHVFAKPCDHDDEVVWMELTEQYRSTCKKCDRVEFRGKTEVD